MDISVALIILYLTLSIGFLGIVAAIWYVSRAVVAALDDIRPSIRRMNAITRDVEDLEQSIKVGIFQKALGFIQQLTKKKQ